MIKVDDASWVDWVGQNKKLVNKLKKSYLSCSPEWFDEQGDEIQNINVNNFEIGKLVFEANGIPSISSVAFDFSFSLGGKAKVSNPDIFDALRFEWALQVEVEIGEDAGIAIFRFSGWTDNNVDIA